MFPARLPNPQSPPDSHETPPVPDEFGSGRLLRLRGYRIVDLDLATPKPPVGHRIADIRWPPHSTILAIRRGQRSFEPDQTERLEHGDRLTILVPAAAAIDDFVETIAADRG